MMIISGHCLHISGNMLFFAFIFVGTSFMKRLKKRTLKRYIREKIPVWGATLIFLTLFIHNSVLSGSPDRAKAPEKPSALPRISSQNGDTAVCDEVYGRRRTSLPLNVYPAGRRFIHRTDVEVRPGFIIRSNSFLMGDNENRRAIKNSFSVHLKYSCQAPEYSSTERIFGGSYQGIGMACYTFNEKKLLGDPLALYLFQGARIANISPLLSFYYEWNFGLSAGWHPYDEATNPHNIIIGSRLNAYIDMNFYLKWILSRRFDLATGVTLTHFSNGNTSFPNAGLNTTGFKAGLIYHFKRKSRLIPTSTLRAPVPAFPRHLSYDLILFGSWRRRGVAVGEDYFALPNTYTVLGFNFAAMYNPGYRFRTGVSLDGFYDGSANIYVKNDFTTDVVPEFFKPPLHQQIALGLSGRTEYVMPYFSVNLGMGVNVLHRRKDLKPFYQILALKIAMTRNLFIHIGYSLQNFNTPNFLMLGIGFRFHNKYPVFCR
jgi:hypothetical protein